MSRIPFFMVTGFLGSGKTTLLKRFLNAFSDGRRIGVVQNEFAPGRADGAELRRTGRPFDLLEINRGSVFCVCLLSDFVRSLAEFADRVRPDAVILEATGLADPIAVGQLIHAPEMENRFVLSRIWCMADAERFLELEATVRQVGRQVRVADAVAVNRSDRVTESRLAEVESRIRALNPFAEIFRTTFARIPIESAFPASGTGTVAERLSAENGGFESCGRPDIGSAVVKTVRPIAPERLEAFLAVESPGLHRIKGFVRLDDGSTAAVQGCFGEVRTETVTDFSGPTEIIAMGPEVSQEGFSRAFFDMLERKPERSDFYGRDSAAQGFA